MGDGRPRLDDEDLDDRPAPTGATGVQPAEESASSHHLAIRRDAQRFAATRAAGRIPRFLREWRIREGRGGKRFLARDLLR